MKATRLLGLADLRDRGVRFSRAYLLKIEKDGRFPGRVRLGPNSIVWREDEIDAWIEARSAARDVVEPAPMRPRGRPRKYPRADGAVA